MQKKNKWNEIFFKKLGKMRKRKVKTERKIFKKKRNQIKWLGFSVSLFNGISTFVSYLMPKPSLLKNNTGTIHPELVSKEVRRFFKGINH